MRKSRTSHHRTLRFEVLERREVMAAGITASLGASISVGDVNGYELHPTGQKQTPIVAPGALNSSSSIIATFVNGVLTITGTSSADSISLRQTNGKISIIGGGGLWTATKVQGIVIRLQDGGNDQVSLDSLANGGNQPLRVPVTIVSGAGNDSVHVSSGHDVSFSGAGHTLVVAASGSATLDGVAVNWSPPTALPAGLSGTVWEDRNNNGGRDVGDEGLAGWHILINGVDRATTDANGYWSVSNLAAGNYTLQEVSQSGWTETYGAAGHSVSLASGASLPYLDFGNFRATGLSGTVWEDRNGNGTRDVGDDGLAGWHILINGVDRATTDANGYWSVTNLAAGNYTLQEVSQSGWTETYGAAGHSVSLASGASLPYLDFGNFRATGLSGTVWEDRNGNGARDVGDQGLAGWHILINGVDRATTDAGGYWSVTNLAAGNYTLQEVSQSGWKETYGAAGHTLSLASGANLPYLDFGNFAATTLSGTVWEDHNGNGARDVGDQGLAGWHILINGVDRATTGAGGFWSVSNLAAGNYTLQEVSQSGWTETYGTAGHAVTVTSGLRSPNLDFANFKAATLSGTVWEDHNGNGTRDVGDQGLAGWHILINGVDRATTGANGSWSVSNLAAGNYTLQEVSQSNWTKTYGSAGHAVTVTSGLNLPNLDFGNYQAPPPPPPAGTWFDANVQDAALRALGDTLYTDSLINRTDILALFQRTESDGTVSSTELADLQRIVANTTLFGNLSYVDKLASYVVNGNSANVLYQGQLMGNLSAGATSTQLANLVNKWFLGLDRPTTPYGYALASGSLFVSGVAYADIDQGNLSDCGFMAALAETAMHTPSTISSMFIANGDGTYTVRFYHSGIAEYVTVDSYLPTNNGNFVYGLGGKSAANSANELWMALAEKAFAQVGEMAYFGRQNSYASIEYLYAYSTLAEITGQSTVGLTLTAGNLPAFASAYNAGNMIVMCSYVNAPNVVSDHCYAVVSYDATNQTVTLFNPWGINNGLTTLSWSQVQTNFYYFDRTA